jgi:hypothetical protein
MKKILPALCLVTTTAFAAPGPSAHALYRLDFELTSTQAGKPVWSTAMFSLNLDEHRNAEAMIGDNVAVAGPSSGTRQNVGIKVKASFEMYGADLLLDVETDLTAVAAPPTIHKIETRDVALATPGKKTVVASIDHDGVHTQLLVTPTKL